MTSELEGSPADGGHLLLVWSPAGYALEERTGPAPRPGELVDRGELGVFGVQKVSPSPLPGDPRPCAFLIREP